MTDPKKHPGKHVICRGVLYVVLPNQNGPTGAATAAN